MSSAKTYHSSNLDTQSGQMHFDKNGVMQIDECHLSDESELSSVVIDSGIVDKLNKHVADQEKSRSVTQDTLELEFSV